MFASVLIANRGEIACRIMRSAKALGMRTIAVYSDADRESLHVRMADEAHRIGPGPAAQSYLSIPALIKAVRDSGADCVHPGYGFLAETAEFAEACAAAGAVFVGPPASAIRAMGLKDAAKAAMQKAGVPVTPGYHGQRQEPRFLRDKAYEVGYPVLIKAVAGGGGRGMRRVDAHMEFESILAEVQREAQELFGHAHVLVEKCVASPRHVEVQVFADKAGHVVHLHERDCSLQRRRQKIVEEAPAPGLGDALREKMGAAAVAAAKAVGYEGAGTVEFIVDASKGLDKASFYFMEMNTRLQVEHPVTEAITGLDLVALQFKVAACEPLGFGQEDVARRGHAIEARLYAEDPEIDFLPSPGRIVALELPTGEGLRVDAGYDAGDVVPPDYDPLIAKIVAHGKTREEALDRLGQALRKTMVAGPKTNLAFLRALCVAPFMRTGRYDTGSIERDPQALGAGPRHLDRQAAATAVAELVSRELARGVAEGGGGPWGVADGFSLAPPRPTLRPFLADGVLHVAQVSFGPQGLRVEIDGVAAVDPGGDIRLVPAGAALLVSRAGRQLEVRFPEARDHRTASAGAGSNVLLAPLHGRLVELRVRVGDRVEQGDRVGTLEAMKLSHALVAPRSGVVGELLAEEDSQVAQGARLMVIGD
ncbi:MAG: carbamoyl-phosphate synthase subunit [Hyphomicrobiales bacterium]|nr:carbamoyl-phosphate synthase subunit [Hyphomicrobiales bacterium]